MKSEKYQNLLDTTEDHLDVDVKEYAGTHNAVKTAALTSAAVAFPAHTAAYVLGKFTGQVVNKRNEAKNAIERI